MKKKLTALLLALAMVLTLAACGTTADNNSGNNNAVNNTTNNTGNDTANNATDGETPTLSGTMKVVATSESYVTLFDKFTEETGVEVELLSMSSGEVLSKLRAEGGTPSADLWFGGGIDAFMSAKDDGLLEQVNFDAAADLAAEYKDADNYWFSKALPSWASWSTTPCWAN